MNYIIFGASIIVVGACVYYLVIKRPERGVIKRNLVVNKKGSGGDYTIDYKETEVIKLSDIGEWLKKLDIDIEDFEKRRIYVVKNIVNSQLGFSDEIKAKLEKSSLKKVLAFVLSDMNNNTKNVMIVIGDLIDEKFESKLSDEVTEIKLK